MHVFKIHSILCVIFLQQISARSIIDDYDKNRTHLIEEEINISLGGKLQLTEDEIIVNDTLMKLKDIELEDAFQNPQKFNLSRHYFTYRDEIKKSKVYQIIRRMPKGGALHIHSSLAVDADFMLRMTYEDHLYACYTDGDLKLQFSDTIPERPCPVQWTLLSEIRDASDDVKGFDATIKKYFTLYSEYEKEMNSDINTVWRKFDDVYHSMKSLISYRPVREKFFYELLKRFYDDNVMYIEIRSGLHSLYELNGTVHDKLYLLQLYKDITHRFIQEYPDFIGVKLILAKHRQMDLDGIQRSLNFARELKSDAPDLFAGFDLVGQEDQGKPLKDFLPALIEAKDDINYYFHGGETNWYGTTTDENLVDAILLGTKRIGHAYALVKHPTLMAMVIEKDIALEINVISNAVLCLVRDVRNHPLATYLALGLPVVLSSDDPGAWGAEPLSHDFYVAFVAVASRHADLRMLKQLALNSIQYSALDNERKERFYKVFDKRWCKFLKEVIENS